MNSGNDLPTVAGIGVIAMCLVTCAHEALGHGTACVLLHGHITLLTSSIFRCDVRSGWIDPAGPTANLLVGTLALVLQRFVSERLVHAKLFLIAVTAFGYLWEGAYAPYAMLRGNGDLYFFARFLLGDVTLPVRLLLALGGIAFYLVAVRTTSRGLLCLWPEPRVARRIAQTLWVSATLGSALAASAFKGQGLDDLRDAVLEVGAAAIPLLFIPRGTPGEVAEPNLVLRRSYWAIGLAIFIFAAFTATLGRGLGGT